MKNLFVLILVSGFLLSSCESVGNKRSQSANISQEKRWALNSCPKYRPITKIQPGYPKEALMNRVQGYCIVEFTIDKSGKTKDLKAIDCQPAGYFEKESIRVASVMRYKPIIENGEPVEVYKITNKYNFIIPDYIE